MERELYFERMGKHLKGYGTIARCERCGAKGAFSYTGYGVSRVIHTIQIMNFGGAFRNIGVSGIQSAGKEHWWIPLDIAEPMAWEDNKYWKPKPIAVAKA